jgi:hypothetical protein
MRPRHTIDDENSIAWMESFDPSTGSGRFRGIREPWCFLNASSWIALRFIQATSFCFACSWSIPLARHAQVPYGKSLTNTC